MRGAGKTTIIGALLLVVFAMLPLGCASPRPPASPPGVARIRIAVTDIKKGTPALNVLPQTKLTGLGLGGASMEAELVDAKTGAQIAGVVQTGRGSVVSLSGLSSSGDAKAVMQGWVKRFQKTLDEAHGN